MYAGLKTVTEIVSNGILYSKENGILLSAIIWLKIMSEKILSEKPVIQKNAH